MSAAASRRSSISVLLPTVSENEALFAPLKAAAPGPPFDVVAYYSTLLAGDDVRAPPPSRGHQKLTSHLQSIAMPIAAVEALAELISRSSSTTTTELFADLQSASSDLAAASFNPISLTCGTSLFLRFLTLQRPPPEMSFREFKGELVGRAREFVKGSGKCREAIAENMADFIRDGSVSWSGWRSV